MSRSVQCFKCGVPLEETAPANFCDRCLQHLGRASWLEDGERAASSCERPRKSAAPQVGEYELIEEVGRGAMGVVYRARQTRLDRWVALKTIQAGPLASPETAQRFHLEAQAAAKLDHPNIVPIYESGEIDGHYYYSMRLIRGRSLAEELADHGPARGTLMRESDKPRDGNEDARAARLVADIAKAIHYAHQRGVLHRDLKPGNILIAEDGSPHVTDFGLAKLLDADSALTLSSAVIGSPAYMAPEQASGGAGESTIATDIYSLGAIFYELLTGQPPFRGGHVAETLRLVTESQPKRPSAIRREIDRDLETICLKCLEKEPQRRYSSGQALVDDLERWQRHEPIQARPAGVVIRVTKWMRRKPAVAALVVAVHVVAGAGLAGIFWQWKQARENAAREQFERRRAEEQAYSADMILAGLAAQDHDLGKARLLLDRHRPRPGSADLRGWEWRYLAGQCLGDEEFTLRAGDHPVSAAFVSNDRLVALSRAGEMQIWDLPNRRLLKDAHVRGSWFIEEVSPDGRWLAAAEENSKQVFIWATDSFELLHAIPAAVDSSHHLLTFSYDGQSAFIVQEKTSSPSNSTNHLIVRLALEPGEARMEPLREGNIMDVACSPDGTCLAAVSDRTVVIHRFSDGSAVVVRDSNGKPIPAGRAAFSADGSRLVVAGAGDIHLVATDTAKVTESYSEPIEGVGGVRFTPDGNFLFGQVKQQVWVQEVKPWRPAALYRGHLDGITKVVSSPDGRWLVTGSRDGTIKFWSGQPKVPAEQSSHSIAQVFNESGRTRFDESRRRLISVLAQPDETEVLVRETETWKEIHRVSIPHDEVVHEELHPVLDNVLDAVTLGDRLAVVRSDERVELWDLESGERTRTLLPAAPQQFSTWGAPFHWVHPFDQGRKLICMQGVFGTIMWVPLEKRIPLRVHVFDLETLHSVVHSVAFDFGVTNIECSPSGEHLIAGGHDGELVLFDFKTGSIKPLFGHIGPIRQIAFSPDGTTMATASASLALWDTRTWQRKALARAHPRPAFALAFHPDGERIVAGGVSASPLGVWSAKNLRELGGVPLPQDSNVTQLHFLDADTLLARHGHWVPSIHNKVMVLQAPALHDLERWENGGR